MSKLFTLDEFITNITNSSLNRKSRYTAKFVRDNIDVENERKLIDTSIPHDLSHLFEHGTLDLNVFVAEVKKLGGTEINFTEHYSGGDLVTYSTQKIKESTKECTDRIIGQLNALMNELTREQLEYDEYQRLHAKFGKEGE